GQIKISDDSVNSLVSIHLTGVDTQNIIEQAQSEDNYGNRVRLIKDLLFEELGVELEDKLYLQHNFNWCATRRSCEIVCGNIWEMADDRLINPGEDWRVIIDFPFDKEGRGPRDDRTKVEKIRNSEESASRAIAWIPSFFSRQAQNELGTLVK